MRKWIGILLTIVMICVTAACPAEGAKNGSGDSTDSVAGDRVVLDNYIYTVYAPEATYVLDMNHFKSFVCITQDPVISEKDYRMQRIIDPEEQSQIMINDQTHFIIWDIETDLMIVIRNLGRNENSIRTQNTSLLSEEELSQINAQSNVQAIRIGEQIWLYYPVNNPNTLYTIYNGSVISVVFGGSDEPDMDLEDTKALLSDLVLQEPEY